MNYDLELERVLKDILKSGEKRVCLQLPSGLKPRAKEIQQFLEKNGNFEVALWAGSCFGACDIPNLQGTGIKLLVQWGHSAWK
ncbi:MAG: hypothetical protein QXW00_03000 [Candidatus Woesearchaeota archaeon]